MPRPSFARLGSSVLLELDRACFGMEKASYLVSLAAGHGTESRLSEAGGLRNEISLRSLNLAVSYEHTWST
jgi:hypothetical protein